MLEFCHDAAEKKVFSAFAAPKFGSYEISSYLCSVNGYLLTIRVSFPRGQAVYVTTHLKTTDGGLLLFSKTIHHHL